MSYAHYLKSICCSDDPDAELSERDAELLFGAMIDGGVPELELGALMVALQMKPTTLMELAGYASAINERLFRLSPPMAKAPSPSQSME